jgi:ABC-2 type transport system permease protein
MSAATLPAPMRLATGADRRPGLGRLVAVELRKMADTRAGLWLLVATVAITLVAVVVRSIVGDAADHTFAAVLNVGVRPAAILLPFVGILLVTSEWSQRTGMITFALVPVRSRVFGAKLLASIVLSAGMVLAAVTIVAAGVLVASPGVDGVWSDIVPLIGQSAVYLVSGMIVGVAFGAVLLASTPAIVALSTLPTAWAVVASLSLFSGVAPWLDTSRALDPLSQEVFSTTQWAHAGTALALWMLLPLMIGLWRITRAEAAQ